jgi:hypothetical protein
MVMAPSWVGRNGYFVVVLVFYRNLQALALVVLGRSLKRYRRQLQIMRYCVWGLVRLINRQERAVDNSNLPCRSFFKSSKSHLVITLVVSVRPCLCLEYDQ